MMRNESYKVAVALSLIVAGLFLRRCVSFYYQVKVGQVALRIEAELCAEWPTLALLLDRPLKARQALLLPCLLALCSATSSRQTTISILRSAAHGGASDTVRGVDRRARTAQQ